jgi:two-component system NarL family sensor kinase
MHINKYKIVAVLLLLVVFESCKNENKNQVFYIKSSNEKLDNTCQWLSKKEHFFEKNYLNTFYNYYNATIKEEKYTDAAKSLEIVSKIKIDNLSFDDTFLKTINSFLLLYKDKIPETKTTFLYSYIANYYCDNGNSKMAILNFKKITKIRAIDYYSCNNLGDAYYSLGYCYSGIGEQELALQNNYKALDCFKKTRYNSGKAYVYSNFTNIYVFTKNYYEAEKNIDKAIKCFKEANDNNNVFMCLYNKIALLDEKKDKRFSILVDSVYNAAKKIKILNTGLKIDLTTCYIQKLVDEGNLSLAKDKLDEIKPIVDSLESESSFVVYSTSLSHYEIKANKGISDILTYEKAIPIFKKNEDFQNLKIIYSLFKVDALSKNDYKKALYFTEEKQKAEESLANELTKVKVIEMETKYKTKQKEQELTLKKLQIEKNKKLISVLITLLVLIVLSIIVIAFFRNKKKLKQEKTLKTMFTKQLLENTEDERKRIANDLHDGISHELLNLKTSSKKDISDLNSKIDIIINEIRQISRNLHPAMFDRVGLEFSIKQLVEYLESKNQFMITTDIKYLKKLTPENELQLYRIIQESLSNIIKYADAHSARVSLKEVGNFLILEIKDNGKGFNVGEKLKGKTAFGLHSIIERGAITGGKTSIFSDNLGTTITVKIPLTV